MDERFYDNVTPYETILNAALDLQEWLGFRFTLDELDPRLAVT